MFGIARFTCYGRFVFYVAYFYGSTAHFTFFTIRRPREIRRVIIDNFDGLSAYGRIVPPQRGCLVYSTYHNRLMGPLLLRYVCAPRAPLGL